MSYIKGEIILHKVLLLIICYASLSFGNNLPPKEKLCPNGDCREDVHIRLTQKDGTLFEQKSDYLYPVIQQMGITILAGEEFSIAGDFVNDTLTNIRVVDDTTKTEPVLSFRFVQKNHDSMLLVVKSHYSKDIKYHLAMMPLEKESLYKTSSCPVRAGLSVYESWPYPIYQLMIPKIFILADEHSGKCEY